MPTINLIASHRAEKKRIERLTRQLFFGLAASAGLFVSTGLYLTAARVQRAADLRDAEAHLQMLQPKLDRIAQVEKDKGILQPKVETLQTAKLNTLRWKAVFQVVSQSLPPDTYLNNLSATGTDDSTSIKLNGLTATQTLVGETMTRLNTNPLFDKIDLAFTQSSPVSSVDPTPRVTFEIGAHLRSLMPPKKDEKDDKNADAAKKTAQAGQRGANNG